MSTISSTEGPHLAGLQAVFFAPAAALTELPDVDGLALLGNLVLRTSSSWSQLHGTIYTPALDVDAVATVHGPGYDHALTGWLPGDQTDAARQFEAMQGRRFVLLYRDFEGVVRLVGDLRGGLEFSYKQATGNKPGEKKGYAWSFKGRTASPALFYAGTMPAGLPAASTAAGSGSVAIYTKSGRYLGTAQAGQKVVITSPFKATIQII
ncbi:MAG: hypothetical protein ACRYFX_07355 [Janthinobacterium lividum]